MVNRWGRDPNFKLRDNNLVSMVAGHWLCSSTTVHRFIRAGMLNCTYFPCGAIRITREQVEEFERRNTVGPKDHGEPD